MQHIVIVVVEQLCNSHHERFSGGLPCQSEFNVIHNQTSSKTESSLATVELYSCLHFNQLFKLMPQFMVFVCELWWPHYNFVPPSDFLGLYFHCVMCPSRCAFAASDFVCTNCGRDPYVSSVSWSDLINLHLFPLTDAVSLSFSVSSLWITVSDNTLHS